MLHWRNVQLFGEISVRSDVVLGVKNCSFLSNRSHRDPFRVAGNENGFGRVDRFEFSQVIHHILEKETTNVLAFFKTLNQ